MKTSEAIEVLKAHNEWRRDDSIPNSKAMVNPTELGKALDKAVEVMGSLKNIEQAIEDTAKENPYRVRGDHSTYTQYNEGWSDACDILGGRIKEVIK